MRTIANTCEPLQASLGKSTQTRDFESCPTIYEYRLSNIELRLSKYETRTSNYEIRIRRARVRQMPDIRLTDDRQLTVMCLTIAFATLCKSRLALQINAELFPNDPRKVGSFLPNRRLMPRRWLHTARAHLVANSHSLKNPLSRVGRLSVICQTVDRHVTVI